MTFDEFCRDTAAGFIQSVIVVDDRATLVEAAPAPRPREVKTPRRYVPTTDEERPPQAEIEIATSEPAVMSDGDPATTPEHDLDGKKLTQKFAAHGVACSIYVPDASSEATEIEDTAKIARYADIVVLDWRLGATGGAKAKEIIRRVIAEDRRENGRLRLITVYTGDPDLRSLRDDVQQDLEKASTIVSPPGGEAGRVRLVGEMLRIVFVNKKHVRTRPDEPGVPEEGLPNLLVQEFAELCQGIMPSVALGAITAMRAASHHLLAKFHCGLDGALAAHRALLTSPEDAEIYATELIAEEIRSILHMHEVGRRYAGIDVLTAWVEHRDKEGHLFRALCQDDHTLSASEVIRLLQVGEAGHEAARSALKKSLSRSAFPASLPSLFFSDQPGTQIANREFSRVAALRREAYGPSFIPAEWVPMLTLGTIVASIGPLPVGSPYPVRNSLICIQAVCDAVRIEGLRVFTLLPLNHVADDTKSFSIVLHFQTGEDGLFMPDHRPYSTLNIGFHADPETRTVRATRKDNRFIFTIADGQAYEWIADLKEIFAQRIVQRLAGRTDRIGLAEYEWLAASREVKRLKESQRARDRTVAVRSVPTSRGTCGLSRSAMMANVRARDTAPEVKVRKALHALGYRFRLCRRDLPGTPDIVLPKYRTVLFVHGCFWHQHDSCLKGNIPKSNMDFWRAKLYRNVERDGRAYRALKAAGWKIVLVWECQTKNDQRLTLLLQAALAWLHG